MSQGVLTGVPKKPTTTIGDQEIPAKNDTDISLTFPSSVQCWAVSRRPEISMDMLECDTGVEGCSFFQEMASALGLVMRSLDPERLNGNHWSTDNG